MRQLSAPLAAASERRGNEATHEIALMRAAQRKLKATRLVEN
jgi:hypothetical protein